MQKKFIPSEGRKSCLTFHQQVQNNIEKFDDDFRFQLTKEEWKILIAKSETGSEAGIYMRIMVLKGELAVKQSKALL